MCLCPSGISGGVEAVGHLLECGGRTAEGGLREGDLSDLEGEHGRSAQRSGETFGQENKKMISSFH